MTFKKASFKEALRADQLAPYFVPWNNLTVEDLKAYQEILSSATREQDLQNFFQQRPICLIQHFGGGHGRWVIPQKQLGAEYVTDFIIGESNSDGFTWTAVELESPKYKMFTKSGDESKYLKHAARQIIDWRSWLETNQNYASRPVKDNGLGLTDISPSIKGLILIGRQHFQNDTSSAFRRQMQKTYNIDIHSYDFILRALAGRLDIALPS